MRNLSPATMPRAARRIRVVGWLLLISGGWELPSLIVTARGKSLGFLLLNIPWAIASIGLGWSLLKGRRRAYVPVLRDVADPERFAADPERLHIVLQGGARAPAPNL